MGRVHRTAVLSAAAVLFFSLSFLMAQTPSGLKVDGAADNRHVSGRTPAFCWDFAGAQTNWHVQVDDDASFQATARHEGSARPSVWFWDSGSQDKGSRGADRCAMLREIVRPGSVSVGLDRRADTIHWRVRVKAGDSWGPWVPSTLRLNQPPSMPAGVEVASEERESTDATTLRTSGSPGRTYHVSPSGDDAGQGAEAAPFRTLTRAVKELGAGDTLVVHGGVYEESLVVSTHLGHARGEPGRQIVVRAAFNEAPILMAAPAGTRAALQIGPDPKLSGWVFDGLTIAGASTQVGVAIEGVDQVAVTNCRWGGTMPRDATGIRVQEGSLDVLISGCQFDQPLSAQIEVAGASGVEVRGNEFSGFDQGRAILARGGAGNLIVTENIFRDAAPAPSAVELAGGSGTRLARNIFSNIEGSQAAAVLAYRGAGLKVEHNVFHGVAGAALQLNERASHGTYRSNIVSSCGVAIRFQGGATAVSGSAVDYNLFSGNGADVDWGKASQALLDHAPAGNCLGGAGGACDPLFVNAGAGDFRLRPGSPAIDAADPFAPIPAGGGQRADAGRHERGAPGGALASYAQQPLFSIPDATPRIRWRLDDLDDRLSGSGQEVQTNYQVQVDPHPTFDALGGGPLLDSGMVTSAAESYVVPSPRALTPGLYYVRVRQWDGHGAEAGTWSPASSFLVTAEGPIRAVDVSPPPGTAADGATPIRARLVADEHPIDPASVRMFVNGRGVTPSLSSDPAGVAVSYRPGEPFQAGSQVAVRLVASLAGGEGGLDTAYTFTVGSTDPAPPSRVRVGR